MPGAKTILSMFDYTGNWALPYCEAGHNVIQIDKKLGVDIHDLNYEWLIENIFEGFETVDVVLAAVPCTDFSSSGAWTWAAKDADGRTAESVELVWQTIRVVDACKPEIWAIENTVGRIAKLVPELGKPWYFQPYWYGDPYTKKTGLWGKFNRNLPRSDVLPWMGSKMHTSCGGKSERTKEIRSETPMGFARAFYAANHDFKGWTDEDDDNGYDSGLLLNEAI